MDKSKLGDVRECSTLISRGSQSNIYFSLYSNKCSLGMEKLDSFFSDPRPIYCEIVHKYIFLILFGTANTF